MRQVIHLLKGNNVICRLSKSYIYDIRWVISRIEKGMIWDNTTKSLVFCHTAFQEDELKSDTTKTQEVLKTIMNSISPHHKFTTESQFDYTNGQLPTLDFTMKMVQQNDSYNIVYLKLL